jgi:inositol 1,4,5-triphosphate receptor type 1
MQFLAFWLLAFFMIWTFVLSNIFIGQIVDAFSAIREEKDMIQEDTETKCLVCSVDRLAYQKDANGDFDEHVRADHDVVCYIFFLHYLKHRHEDFHSGCARPHGCLLRLCTQAGQPQHCYGQHQQQSR